MDEDATLTVRGIDPSGCHRRNVADDAPSSAPTSSTTATTAATATLSIFSSDEVFDHDDAVAKMEHWTDDRSDLFVPSVTEPTATTEGNHRGIQDSTTPANLRLRNGHVIDAKNTLYSNSVVAVSNNSHNSNNINSHSSATNTTNTSNIVSNGTDAVDSSPISTSSPVNAFTSTPNTTSTPAPIALVHAYHVNPPTSTSTSTDNRRHDPNDSTAHGSADNGSGAASTTARTSKKFCWIVSLCGIIVVLAIAVTAFVTLYLTSSSDDSPTAVDAANDGGAPPPSLLATLAPVSISPLEALVSAPQSPVSTSSSPPPLPSTPWPPSLRPTMAVLSSPASTAAPYTLFPTAPPTVQAIIPVASTTPPMLAPTTAASPRATSITNFINGSKLSTGTLTVPISTQSIDASSVTTAEQAALVWLVNDDPLQLSPDTVLNQLRLQQRYALLTFLIQFPAFTAAAAFFNSSDTEYNNATASLGSTLSLDLGLLSNLQYFSAYNNALVGSIPSTFGSMWNKLEFFSLASNAITGTLSSSLGSAWANLQVVWASGNALTGSIPSTLGTTWTNLASFELWGNDLTGSIPSAICLNATGTLVRVAADCLEQ